MQKKISHKKLLYRHIRQAHDVNFRLERNYTCHHCNSSFSCKNDLKCHIIPSHIQHTACPIKKNRKIICAFQKCEATFPNYLKYEHHINFSHNAKIEMEDLCFGTETEFTDWKDSLNQQATHYSKECDKRNQNGAVVEYYRCNRSYMRNIKNKKRIKFTGSIKTGIACP